MRAPDEVAYRIALAEGFLAEAEQDLKRWRSCVDNAQLSVENAGKAVLSLFSVSPKTHEPSQQLAALLRDRKLPDEIQDSMRKLLPELLALGKREHFLTDYGDEATYTLPWDLFTRDSGDEALEAARRSLELSKVIIDRVRASWNNSPPER